MSETSESSSLRAAGAAFDLLGCATLTGGAATAPKVSDDEAAFECGAAIAFEGAAAVADFGWALKAA